MMDLNKDKIYNRQPIRFNGCNGVITAADFENNLLTIEMELPASMVENAEVSTPDEKEGE